MKILIVGAGRMAEAIAYNLMLRKYNDIETICLVDSSQEALDKFDSNNPKIKTISWKVWEIPVDFIADYDVMIGAVSYEFNEELTAKAIDAKTHMCDLGGNNSVVEKQLEMSSEAQKAGVTIIPDCGLAPGLANMLAANGIEILGGKAKRVEIAVGGLPQKPNPPFNYQSNWSITGLINEYIEPCKVLRAGNIEHVPALSESVDANLPLKPYMESERLYSYEKFHTSGGISTMCESYFNKVDNITYKTIRYKGHCQVMKAIKDLEYMNNPDRKVLEERLHRLIGKEHYYDKVIIHVHVSNSFAGQVNTVDYLVYDKYHVGQNLSAMARCTGFSAASVAYMLPNLDKRGVLPGEKVLPLKKYIKDVYQSGIEIHEDVRCTDEFKWTKIN